MDLVLLDTEGYLCLWERARFGGKLVLAAAVRTVSGTGFYSCLLPIFEPGRPPRFLLQYSRPYWAQSANVEHRWIEPRPVDVGIRGS